MFQEQKQPEYVDSEVNGPFFKGPFGRGGHISGWTASGWEQLRVSFESNFAENLELGAQLVVYRGEELVVDLCGKSSQQKSYSPEHMQCVFSSGKNIEALCIAILIDRNLCDYDDLVTKHWPEFANGGKDKITIADVLRHEGGVPAFTKEGKVEVVITPEMVEAVEPLDKAIEQAELFPKDPENPGKAKRIYHAISRGWLIAGIVRRIDEKKRNLGLFIREEITAPLGLKYYHLGIPLDEQKNFDFADMTQMNMAYNITCEILPAMMGFGSNVLKNSLKVITDKKNPMGLPVCTWMAKQPTPTFNNSPKGRSVEIPSAGVYANARCMGKINALLANGGEIDGVRLLSAETCDKAHGSRKRNFDDALQMDAPFSQGGFCSFGETESILMDAATKQNMAGFVGWGGWGGSVSVWNPSKKISFAYTMNGMSNFVMGCPRGNALLSCVQDIIAAQEL